MSLPPRTSLALHRFHPRLLDHLRGYSRDLFVRDLGAGITVAVVALPLAMAFAIASGVKPEQGIFTAIIAGFLISALGGSSVQIGGPAGAFIVIVFGIVQRYGLTNLLIATVLAGVLLFVMGALKLGAVVRYMPVTIVLGFTNGIAVLIAMSQIRDLLGLSIDHLPSDFFAQLYAYANQLGTINWYAFGLGSVCLAGLFFWPHLFSPGEFLPKRMLEGVTLRTASRMPGPIIALVSLTLFTVAFHVPVETIGTRFGGIPQGLPSIALPPFSWESAKQLFIPTLTIALLGAIESLLCARVADNLVDLPRHDPNQELMAQGIANMVTPFFGGIPATGTIARTVTNVRAGARTPVSGIVHAATLLAIVLAAAPLAEYIPLAVLAGILLFVAWNMGEWHQFARLRQYSLPYRVTVLTTFVLTVMVDLTVAVQVGLLLACGFFVYRMGRLFHVDPHAESTDDVHVLSLYGALFFGAVGKVEAIGKGLPVGTRALVLDAQRLVSMDTSGLDALQQLKRVLDRQGVRLLLCDLNDQPSGVLRRSGFDQVLGRENIVIDVGAALAVIAAEETPASR